MDDRLHVKTTESYEPEPTASLLLVCTLDGRDTVWVIIMVKKALSKFMDEGADRSIMGKSGARKIVCSSEAKHSLSLMEGIHYNQPVLAGSLMYSIIWFIIGLCCWQIILRRYMVARSTLVREKSVLLHNFQLVPIATVLRVLYLLSSLIENDCKDPGDPIHFIIETS